MNNIICCIAKNEHLYINEWVKYHLDLGFGHIYIGDNDDIGAPYIGDFIDAEIRHKVTIINLRGIREQWFQQNFYNTFYHKMLDKFDWCAFIDVDEFIVLNKWNTLNDFLQDNRFLKYNTIMLGWHLYGDDGVCTRDISVPVFDFFKKRLNIVDIPPQSQVLYSQGKQITRGGFEKLEIHNHSAFTNGKVVGACTTRGTPCFQENHVRDIEGIIDDSAYINHYMTKTLEEFLNQKYGRGDAMFSKRSIDISYYWRINRPTPEKLAFIDRWMRRYKDEK